MVSSAYLRLLIFLLAILILARASSSPAFLIMYAAYKLKKQDDNKYSFPYLEPVCCSMPSSYCCFLTSIQISQEADKMVWYSHLLKNFLQFVVIYTVKGFGVVNKAEVDVFLGLFHILIIQHMLEIWSLVPLPFLFFYFILFFNSFAFSKSCLNLWKFTVHILLKPGLENFEHYNRWQWSSQWIDKQT